MGEAESTPFRPSFNGSVRIESRGEFLSADAGAFLLREVDHRLDLLKPLGERLADPRNPALVVHPMVEMVRARVFAMALGHGAQDAHDLLRFDPVLRIAVSQRAGTGPLDDSEPGRKLPCGLPSQPTQSRLVQILSGEENRAVLEAALAEWAVKNFRETGGCGPVVLDVDSFPIEAYGEQPGSAWNGHYGMNCFHPLITMLSDTADVVGLDPRPGNVFTAAGALGQIDRVIERIGPGVGGVGAIRGDAGFASGAFLDGLESRGLLYALRLPSNSAIERIAAPHLPEASPEAPGQAWTREIRYRAGSWSTDRRVVLVVVDRPGELFLDHFFLVTNFPENELSGEAILEFYRARATMERHIGEIKSVLSPALSCTNRPKGTYRGNAPATRTAPRDACAANAATLLLYMLGYNLMNIVRNLAATILPPDASVPSLSRIRTTMLRIAARLVRTARRAVFTINERSRAAWSALIRRIERIRPVRRIC